jgi:hypothetical protein
MVYILMGNNQMNQFDSHDSHFSKSLALSIACLNSVAWCVLFQMHLVHASLEAISSSSRHESAVMALLATLSWALFASSWCIFYAPWQKTQGMATGQFFRKAALSKTMADKADTPHSKLQQKNASIPGLFHRRCAPGLSVGCPCNLQRLAKCHSEVEMS